VLGVLLYIRSPELPEDNTYDYYSDFSDTNPSVTLRESGFNVTNINARVTQTGIKKEIQVSAIAHTLNDCTDLVLKDTVYKDRTFTLILEAQMSEREVCSGGITQKEFNYVVNLGPLSDGVYFVSAGGQETYVDISNVSNETENPTTTPVMPVINDDSILPILY
jgi:hypothetical protein